MYDLAVFAALEFERRAVTDCLRSVAAAGPRAWRGSTVDGTSCLVVQTGVGAGRARSAAEAAPPAHVYLMCGCAGALAPSLTTGDLVVADRIVRLEGEGSLSAETEPLVTWAGLRGFPLHVGPIASSSSVLATASAKRSAGETGALAVEMESSAVAAVAHAREIPFIGIRVVLDVVGQAVPAALLPAGGIVDETTGRVRAGRAVARLASRPWLWPGCVRLARQQRLADRQLRALLSALFGEGGSGAFAVASAPRRVATS
jgi:adenosylhomocysteine nucleosidase